MTLPTLLEQLYPQHVDNILEELQTHLKKPSSPLPHQSEPDWYQHLQLYVAYPETFRERKHADFHTLAHNLDYIKKLGCNAIHVLPFFNSPLIDRGFDISDFTRVRPSLGGNYAFDYFLNKAHQKEVNVFIDLVLNHTSDQHPWFQKAVHGDTAFRDFYIWENKKPELLRRWEDDIGFWAEYQLAERKITARIIFPDQNEELPHWRLGLDGNWYYHTFYSNQLDLNWNNPAVFLTFAEILMYWAKKGVNFRLDAIPFIGKQVKKGIIESADRTHQIVQTFHQLLDEAAPQTAFLVEACQPLPVTKSYFGINFAESEFAYNFRLMQGLWASLVSANTNYVWQALADTADIPDWAQWITFLRNHDELTLEFANVQERLLIYEGLKGNGLPFRAGFGLSGRTTSLVNGKTNQLLTAYLLLASLPGVPAIVYGDELGKGNDLEYMNTQAKLRKYITGHPDTPSDTRDANRGIITNAQKSQPSALGLYYSFSQIFTTRKRFPEIATSQPQRLENVPTDIWAAHYQMDRSDMYIYINLGDEPFQCSIPQNSVLELTINGARKYGDRVLVPSHAGVWIRQRRA